MKKSGKIVFGLASSAALIATGYASWSINKGFAEKEGNPISGIVTDILDNSFGQIELTEKDTTLVFDAPEKYYHGKEDLTISYGVKALPNKSDYLEEYDPYDLSRYELVSQDYRPYLNVSAEFTNKEGKPLAEDLLNKVKTYLVLPTKVIDYKVWLDSQYRETGYHLDYTLEWGEAFEGYNPQIYFDDVKPITDPVLKREKFQDVIDTLKDVYYKLTFKVGFYGTLPPDVEPEKEKGTVTFTDPEGIDLTLLSKEGKVTSGDTFEVGTKIDVKYSLRENYLLVGIYHNGEEIKDSFLVKKGENKITVKVEYKEPTPVATKVVATLDKDLIKVEETATVTVKDDLGNALENYNLVAVEGENLVTINKNVITAKEAGTFKFKVTSTNLKESAVLTLTIEAKEVEVTPINVLDAKKVAVGETVTFVAKYYSTFEKNGYYFVNGTSGIQVRNVKATSSETTFDPNKNYLITGVVDVFAASLQIKEGATIVETTEYEAEAPVVNNLTTFEGLNGTNCGDLVSLTGKAKADMAPDKYGSCHFTLVTSFGEIAIRADNRYESKENLEKLANLKATDTVSLTGHIAYYIKNQTTVEETLKGIQVLKLERLEITKGEAVAPTSVGEVTLSKNTIEVGETITVEAKDNLGNKLENITLKASNEAQDLVEITGNTLKGLKAGEFKFVVESKGLTASSEQTLTIKEKAPAQEYEVCGTYTWEKEGFAATGTVCTATQVPGEVLLSTNTTPDQNEIVDISFPEGSAYGYDKTHGLIKMASQKKAGIMNVTTTNQIKKVKVSAYLWKGSTNATLDINGVTNELSVESNTEGTSIAEVEFILNEATNSLTFTSAIKQRIVINSITLYK